MIASKSRPLGFTLTELLVVLLILTILMSFLIPFAKKSMVASHWAKGTSNLRQVTMTMLLYAQDNDGRLVPGQDADGVWWHRMVSRRLANDPTLGVSHKALFDPLVKVTSTSNAVFHFAPLACLAPQNNLKDIPPYAGFEPYRRLATHRAPAQQIYLADAGLDPNGGGAHGTISNVDTDAWLPYSKPAKAEMPITVTTGAKGSIRWTDGKAKCSFMDGHIEILKKADVKKKNVNPFYQDL